MLDALTEEKTVETYKIIDKTIRNLSINNLQSLKHFLEMLINVSLDHNLDNNKKEEKVINPKSESSLNTIQLQKRPDL
ncbi:4210_t:CDS:2 [Scutellospora calospora]|uniref:4210_t:CDS:1 n=1 Tax=Scutellospora calospora TaxID=85575 RepID=A0ACA9MIT3_9GLOM|nr:4210_t:CDS:2 [Scutellospora calospora]